MIGTETDARLALTLGPRSPQCIGIGYYRYAFLINGVVYKVLYTDEDGDINQEEYDSYVRLCLEHDVDNGPVRIPRTGLFTIDGVTVISMEYIDGQLTGECYCTPDEPHTIGCVPEWVIEIAHIMDIFDIGYGNIVERDTIFYIIDFTN